MKQFFIALFIGFGFITKAQLYFPPNGSSYWDTTSSKSLGWCPEKVDSLYDFLDTNGTKAFILLKDGKIVLEKYFNGHNSSTNWYWASAGKTLTAVLVGIAQQENYLNIDDTTSKYLGQGWTDSNPVKEEKITIRHQLTMTSGLDDGVPDPYCTLDSCLIYKADAGTRWAYHNAPYTILDQVIENATNQTLNAYTHQKIKGLMGMDGTFIKQVYNNVYISSARSMARFGLLMLNNGNWNGNPILTDLNYFNEMVNPSQTLNESYGYLWWLNGQNSFMVPQSQIVINGSICPNAPYDMIAALGKNAQLLNVVPSQNIVWIRMGEAPDNSLIPSSFNDDIWEYLNDINCNNTAGIKEMGITEFVYPNPMTNLLHIKSVTNFSTSNFELINSMGQIILKGKFQNPLDVSSIMPGTYYLKVFNEDTSRIFKVMKE